MSNLTLTVQLDCTERLEKVLKGIADSLCKIQTVAPKVAQTEEKTTEQKETQAEAQAETEQVAQPQENETARDEITDADLRDIMRETRARVLGENVNDGIMKKALNDKFREKVSAYGCKASTDMNQKQRVEFVEFCKNLPVMATEEEPF